MMQSNCYTTQITRNELSSHC